MSLAAHLINRAASEAASEAARKLNVDDWTAARLAPIAASIILFGLCRKTSDFIGATAFEFVLRRNHEDLLSGPRRRFADPDIRARGEAQLDWILKLHRRRAIDALADMAGIDAYRSGAILAMTAAAVISALAQAKRRLGLGAFELQGVVKSESAAVDHADPELVRDVRRWVFRAPIFDRFISNMRAALRRRFKLSPRMAPAE